MITQNVRFHTSIRTRPTGCPVPALCTGVLIVAFLYNSIFKRRYRLPPGPRSLPLIGVAHLLPGEWHLIRDQFSSWVEEYGPMVFISALNQKMLLVSSAKVAFDLLEKRGGLYCDRPNEILIKDMMGYGDAVPFIDTCPRHRKYRQLMSTVLAQRKLEQYQEVQEKLAREFLDNLLTSPQDWRGHIRRSVAATVFHISHGYTISGMNDPFVQLAEQVNLDISDASRPGAYLVNQFPFLRYLPGWFPGGSVNVKVQEWRKRMKWIRDTPFQYVKDQMLSGKAVPSFTSALVESSDGTDSDEEYTFKWASASLYGAGADTSVAALKTFVLAMIMFPDVQKKAQAEIDAIVGSSRLPGFNDRHNLPYICALVREIHRWNPVAPNGVPHRLTQDDNYDGYDIPAGTIVMVNARGILNDPKLYPSPDEFNPDRYVASDDLGVNPNPESIAFGFGRRICPGQHLANATIFISVATMLAVFDFAPDGTIGDVRENRVDSAFIGHPGPFNCRITPRSKDAITLIQGATLPL